jgi:predicted MFS family arabinose efflux permease
MNKKHSAYYFIILMGIVSLFSDFTHEGARSIYGPFLGLLGASAESVSLVSGLGELIGYSLILFTGALIDKTKKYWLMMLLGYLINLVCIPLLAFSTNLGAFAWGYACILIVLERVGRSMRKPAKTSLVSFAASEVGPGKGFAIQEALDQIGACLGPALLFVLLSIKRKGAVLMSTSASANANTLDDYAQCFLVLGIGAIVTLGILFAARKLYPHPQEFEAETPKVEAGNAQKFSKAFWLYVAAISFIGFGFADYPLIAFHFARENEFGVNIIPLLYAGAMGIDALSALVFGSLYDKAGLSSLMIAVFLSAFFAPFVFLAHSRALIIAGVALWGIGMGAQESILKAVVTSLVPKDRRATAYGIFNAGFGVFWFAGSAIMGFVYNASLVGLVFLSMAAQLIAIPILFIVRKQIFNGGRI